MKAYEAALPPESKFGAPAPLDKVEKHEAVQGIDYLRQRAVIVAEDNKTALSLKGFLKGYFPLIKPSELAECLDVCLARRGVGPFAGRATRGATNCGPSSRCSTLKVEAPSL